VLAVDDGTAAEADPAVPAVVLDPGEFEVHGDRPGHAADGQFAGDPEVDLVDLLDRGRREVDGGVVGRGQVPAAQLLVALLVAGLDALGLVVIVGHSRTEPGAPYRPAARCRHT